MSEAARKLGGGDFTARAPVDGCTELADFAVTFNIWPPGCRPSTTPAGSSWATSPTSCAPHDHHPGLIDGMLDGTIPPEEQKKYLEIVSQETGRLSRLVKNMPGHHQAGSRRVPGPCPQLQHLGHRHRRGAVRRAADRGCQNRHPGPGRRQDAGLPPTPDFVHQVVYNIVDNAIKFTPPGGIIRFAEKRLATKIELSIENTGAGISRIALPFVFDRFYKEDRSRGLNARGSGLGLPHLQRCWSTCPAATSGGKRGGQMVPLHLQPAGGRRQKGRGPPAASGPIASGKAGRR